MPTIEDLQPKPFTVTVKGVELSCKPLKLSHALIMAKVGNVLQDSANTSKQQIKEAEADITEVIGELIPELANKELDMTSLLSLIEQMMNSIQPEDNKKLKDQNVKVDTDPKV